MSPPEALRDPNGAPVTLAVAGPDQIIEARVVAISGAGELELAERRLAAQYRSPVALETALLLLAVEQLGGVSPEAEALGELSLGDRNRLVLAALTETYGVPETLLLPCTHAGCGTQVEIDFDPTSILNAEPMGPSGPRAIEIEGQLVHVRPPCGADLAALARAGRDGAADLLALCAPGAPRTPAAEALVVAEIERRDPYAEMLVESLCPGCGSSLAGTLDPLALFVQAMDAGGGVLGEVDLLARTYHWPEREILALPTWRRRLYLRAIRAAEPVSFERRAS